MSVLLFLHTVGELRQRKRSLASRKEGSENNQSSVAKLKAGSFVVDLRIRARAKSAAECKKEPPWN